jgi:hypothetical protein
MFARPAIESASLASDAFVRTHFFATLDKNRQMLPRLYHPTEASLVWYF